MEDIMNWIRTIQKGHVPELIHLVSLKLVQHNRDLNWCTIPQCRHCCRYWEWGKCVRLSELPWDFTSMQRSIVELQIISWFFRSVSFSVTTAKCQRDVETDFESDCLRTTSHSSQCAHQRFFRPVSFFMHSPCFMNQYERTSSGWHCSTRTEIPSAAVSTLWLIHAHRCLRELICMGWRIHSHCKCVTMKRKLNYSFICSQCKDFHSHSKRPLRSFMGCHSPN